MAGYDWLIGTGFDRWSSGGYTPGQRAMMADNTSFQILNSGSYRSGKSEGMDRKLLYHALCFSNAHVGVFRAKLTSLKASTLRTLLQLVHPSWVADWNNSNLTLRLISGSVLSCMGADFSDRIGSVELSMAGCDEYHEFTREAAGMIVGRLSSPLTPVPTDDPAVKAYQKAAIANRQLIAACNPKSPGHWLYKDFIDPETRLPGRNFYASNSIQNPFIPESYLIQNLANFARPGVEMELLRAEVLAIREGRSPLDGMRLKELLNPLGQRNLLGLWVAMEGQILELDEARHKIKQIPWEAWGQPSARWVGVDHGFHNPRLIELLEWPDGRFCTGRLWAGQGNLNDDLVGELEKWHHETPITRAFFPHDQPQERMKASAAIGASKVAKAKTEVMGGIGTLQTLVGGDFYFYDNGSNTAKLAWSELEGYQWKMKDGEYLDEPLKENDHYCDSLRYLVHTLAHQRQGNLFKQPAPDTLTQPELYSRLEGELGYDLPLGY